MLLTQWLSRFSLSRNRRHRRRLQVQEVFRQSDGVDVLEDRVMLSGDTWFQPDADIDGEAAGHNSGMRTQIDTLSMILHSSSLLPLSRRQPPVLRLQ
jgi:hypothetical protein